MNDSATFDSDAESLDRLEIVDVLARDFLARFRNGDRPTVEEYAHRHIELADDIRRMFPLVASIEKVKIDDQESVDGRATLAGRELDRLGDFRIIREIGRGGMGIVYEAEQESLGRRVAIKVLPKQSLLEDRALDQFRREAQTAAAMHHSNIVPIHGTGEFEGSHYLVMQLVDGVSLDKKLADPGVSYSFTEVAVVGKQVADAIAYAHESGVLHRDIKPANILIEADGTAQVTDFGLATNLNDDPTITRTLSGSLRYMAPERFRGISEPRSDVYSIGLTLYEMLAGGPAFEQSDTNALLAVIAKPPTRSIKNKRSDIPIDLETIVMKAMNPEPKLRYASSADLRDDLNRFLSDEPIHARRTSWIQRCVRWCRRDPKTAIAAMVAVTALLAATIASSAAYFLTAAANNRTNSALNRSEEITDLAIATLDNVVDDVSLSPLSTQMEIGDDGLWDIERASTSTLVSASPNSARVLESLRPLYEGLLAQTPNRPDIVRRMVDASVQHARVLDQLGHADEAIENIQRGISILETHGDVARVPNAEKATRLARLQNELGLYYSAAYQFDASDAAHQQAISIAESLSDSVSSGQLELARAHVFLGDLPPRRRRLRSGRLDKEACSQHLIQAMEILEGLENGSDDSANDIAVDVLKSRTHLGLSRLDEADGARDQHMMSAIEILKTRLVQTPDSQSARFELVNALSDQDLREWLSEDAIVKASKSLIEALEYLRPLRDGHPGNPEFAVAEIHIRHKYASVLRKLNETSKAETQVGSAIDIQSTLMESFPDSVSHRCWRALLYRSLAQIKLEQNDSQGSEAAIGNAKEDVRQIPEKFSDHEFVKRVRRAVSGFAKRKSN